jgi:hypothetical protein
MRWVFLLLLVLNSLYYGWSHLNASAQSSNVLMLEKYPETHESIRLVSDRGAYRESDPVALPTGDVCLYLGGMAREESVRQLEQRLLSLDIQADIEEVDSTVATDYWLYLPPLASRQASLRLLKELQARKIDGYIITQGDLVNGVSLGIFPNSDSAGNVMQRLRDAGYQPAMRELPRAHREYWARIALESNRLVDDELLKRLSLSFPGLRHEQKACRDVTNGESFK